MVAAGAVLEYEKDGTILIQRRAPYGDGFLAGQWELVYGRIAQHEDPLDGLKRELFEETGQKSVTIIRPLRTWHIYRGEKKEENEVIGITFWCKTKTKKVVLSSEHNAYAWVSPQTALKRITFPGVRKEIRAYMKAKEEAC